MGATPQGPPGRPEPLDRTQHGDRYRPPAWQLWGVIGLYLIVLNVEPHILVPRIMVQAVGLSPLLTIVALLLGVKLGGITGGFLAIPVAAAVQVVVKEVVREIRAQPDLVVIEEAKAEAEPETSGVVEGSKLLPAARRANLVTYARISDPRVRNGGDAVVL